MNVTHFNQIVSNYIDKFEYLNDKDHWEYYKWEIAGQFRTVMDAALSASADDFPKALSAAKKLSANLIDSYTQPFSGLVEFSKREPETVRGMFLDLYAVDDGDVTVKQKRIFDFLQASHALRDRYYPDSFLYNDDIHSVSGYVFLYDPDHNYLYKPEHAKAFADCIEFMEDWGSGSNTRLDIFYRMCDEVVAQIKRTPELLKTDSSRFDPNVFVRADSFHPDTEKHILCSDLIYCSSTYKLFQGMSFRSIPTHERKLYTEKKQKALLLKAAYDQAIERANAWNSLEKTMQEMIVPGASITHKSFGNGVIVKSEDGLIVVDFGKQGTKTLGIASSFGGGFLQTGSKEFDALVSQNKTLLLDAKNIPARIKEAKRQLIPYTEYLD